MLTWLMLACGGSVAPSEPVPSEPAPQAALVSVKIFLLDEDAFAVGREPYLVPVERSVPAADPVAGALRALFEGPTAEEAKRKLSVVRSDASGFSDLVVSGGIATLRLAGGCNSQGSTLTIYDHLSATLLAFDHIDHVRLLDPSGQGGEGGADRPPCLEP